MILKKWLSPVYRLVGGATKHRFPFVHEEIEGLGEVFLPLVEAGLWLPETKTWLDFQFIVDTGATATILPAFIASKLGFDLDVLSEIEMAGVEGTGVKSWRAKVAMRINGKEFNTRCFFVDNSNAPFLLGRADVLDKIFTLKVDSKNKEVVLIENNF